MTQVTKHTPGPWRIVHPNNSSGDVGIHAPGLNNILAECFSETMEARQKDPELAEANAQRIVTAVNCHDDLLEALIMVRDADNDCLADDLPTIPQMARAKIDDAISKATGEAK